jgi:hypothetical protein
VQELELDHSLRKVEKIDWKAFQAALLRGVARNWNLLGYLEVPREIWQLEEHDQAATAASL